MQRLMLTTALAFAACSAGAQTPTAAPHPGGAMREIEDKIALRELVDTFAVLADKKDVRQQLTLFTASATVETFRNGASAGTLNGTEAIGKAFAAFLQHFHTVYHFNGQHVVSVQGDRATGTLYCLTYLFGTENGNTFRTTFGIRYQDEYVRERGKWLIAKRTSYFDWQQRDAVPPPQ